MPERQSMRLDQYLKLCGAADSGGQAKYLIQAGEVSVNGVVVTQRRRKLADGDRIRCGGNEYQFEESDESGTGRN